MRLACVLLLIAACGPALAPAQTQQRVVDRPVPRLRPPPLPDPDARGATYLAAVALQLQPVWGQFLNDCRLRLPATHPLNDMALAATAELAIDVRGQVTDVQVETSGNADFDRAVRDVVRDANPVPAPPRELWSDDDRVHLRWVFARDRRQAGPATAQVIDVQLPVVGVVERLITMRDLTRAARRVRNEQGDRSAAMQLLVVAMLREALASSDTAVRRSAVEAIGRAQVTELVADVRSLLASTGDIELRLVAISGVAKLRDDRAATLLLDSLARDIVESPKLARAEMGALVSLDREAELARWLRSRVGRNVDPMVIEGLAYVDVPELRGQLKKWQASSNVRIRAAACRAAPSARGLRDRDATVRATCVDAIREPAKFRSLLAQLTKDRDVLVRAGAVKLLAMGSVDDAAPEVRAAYAQALPPTHADVRVLLEDRDPDVRAAAWTTFVRGDATDKANLAAGAALDPAAQVRKAAVPAVDDDAALGKLATTDEAGDVRTEATVQLAMRRGRAAATDPLLDRMIAAPAGSSEHVRAALAWLLAR